MDSIFINCENSKTSDPHRLLLNLSDKLNMLLYQTLVFTIHGKIQKSYTKIENLKYQLRYGMESLNYLMDHNMLLYQTLVFTIHGKIKKSYTKIKNLEFREWRV